MLQTTAVFFNIANIAASQTLTLPVVVTIKSVLHITSILISASFLETAPSL